MGKLQGLSGCLEATARALKGLLALLASSCITGVFGEHVIIGAGGGLAALLASFMADFYSQDIVGIGGSVQRGLWGRTTELPV